MRFAALTAMIYGILVLVGGIIGYAQAQSMISLIAGLVFGVIVVISGWLAWQGMAAGVYVAAGSAMLLGLFFGYRLSVTGNFMPAGMMLTLSFVALVIIVLAFFISLEKA
jgi:uncharacterized membrane protein (UPF0136 family)